LTFIRRSDIFLLYIAANLSILVLAFVHADLSRETARESLVEKSEMVKSLELTDLCLFTDARYARHPAVADMHSAFQDMPMAFEHFPSGSIMIPPPHIKKLHGTH